MQNDTQRALILGGTHGMGLASAKALLDRGADVTVTGSNPANLDRLAATHTALRVMKLDLAAEQDIDALPLQLAGRTFDTVLVFAAVAEFGAIAEVERASFDRQFAVNTRGVFLALQHLVSMVVDGGSIVLTTVTPGTASPGMGVYMATKAAVGAYGRVLAAELLPRRIRVNMLAPGFVDTPTLGVAGLTAEERSALSEAGDAATPMQRHGTVDEIAKAALFLACDATFSTGIELVVDGGLSTVDAP